ncbi:MAG: PorT family protein [Lentimicrobiaceae bacterium]|nr:PorT family protein [Lentimicrobiaceae bacterium]MCB9024437.1 PorT family protein [Lentimicrobiaceae bacterium]MCO5265616.1 PorT family protein [Lentimicrobium sp.]
MKHINSLSVVFIVVLMLFSLQSAAQYKSVSLGIKVAPSLGWLKTDQDGYRSDGVVPGIAWGLVAEFYFAENYAFGTGFNFNFQNGKLSYPDEQGLSGAGVLSRKYRFKYLEIPAVIKMRTNEIKGFRFFGQVGMGFGVRLNSKAKDVFEVNGSPDQTVDFRLIDSQTNLFKASMIVGAGVEYPFDNSSAIVAGINFNNGFSDVLKGKNAVFPEREHHGVPNFVEISLAVMF